MNRFVVELLKLLQDIDGPDVADTLIDELVTETARTTDWPSDEEFWDACRNTKVYKDIKQARVRMILRALELDMRSSMSEEGLPTKLPIEHVLPQGWDSSQWPIDTDDADAVERRNTLLHSFGNLTLVTTRLNGAMSNGSWEAKRTALGEHSVLRLNREIVEEYEVWDESAIESRGAMMADHLCRIWPRPEPSMSTD